VAIAFAFANVTASPPFSSWLVRSPLGVAETGSVLLSEKELRVNTIGFLAHDIVILLDPKNIVENIHPANIRTVVSGTAPATSHHKERRF
jgi:L-lactate dehydrogenase complex protein LldG